MGCLFPSPYWNLKKENLRSVLSVYIVVLGPSKRWGGPNFQNVALVRSDSDEVAIMSWKIWDVTKLTGHHFHSSFSSQLEFAKWWVVKSWQSSSQILHVCPIWTKSCNLLTDFNKLKEVISNEEAVIGPSSNFSTTFSKIKNEWINFWTSFSRLLRSLKGGHWVKNWEFGQYLQIWKKYLDC